MPLWSTTAPWNVIGSEVLNIAYFGVIACIVMFVCKDIRKGVCAFMLVCKNICIVSCPNITVYGVEDKPCLYGGVVYGATGGHLGVRVAMTVAYFAKLYFQYSMYICSVYL